jgi:hypothetical protein
MVRLGIEFLELELNSYSNCEFRGKKCLEIFLKLCLGLEFCRLKSIVFFFFFEPSRCAFIENKNDPKIGI